MITSMDKSAEQIREGIRSALKVAHSNDVHIPTAGQRGAVVGILNKICGGDGNRRLLIGWLFANPQEYFSAVSTKLLDDYQWSALYGWIDFRKEEDLNLWIPKPDFVRECLACLTASMRDYHNMRVAMRDEVPTPPELVSVATTLGGEISAIDGGKGAGVKGNDAIFVREKPLPIPPSPPPDNAPKERSGLREPLKTKPPKLINPF